VEANMVAVSEAYLEDEELSIRFNVRF